MVYRPYGKATYGIKEREIAAMLADESIPESIKDEIITRGRDEVKASWSEMEAERRAGETARRENGEWIRPTPIQQVEVHHSTRGNVSWSVVE